MAEGSLYDGIAPYYDVLYGAVDHAADVAFLLDAFQRYARVPVTRVLDLGCGTGTHALLLAAKGVDVVGVDLSGGLVRRAREKAAEAPGDVAARVRFEHGDMTSDLPTGPFDAAVSLFGSFNHVTDDARVERMFRHLADRVRPGGLVAFEFWSPMGIDPKRHRVRADAPDGGHVYYLLDGAWDADADVYTIGMEGLHVAGERVLGRFNESHPLRARTPATVRRLLEQGGLALVAFVRGDVNAKSHDAPPTDAMRVMAFARVP